MKRIPKKRKVEQLILFSADTMQGITILKEEETIDDVVLIDVVESKEVGLVTNQIYCGDTVETMKKIKDKSINLILTSPPYLASIRKDNHKYPGAKDLIKDNQPVKEYVSWLIDVFKEYERILTDDGVIVFNYSYTTFNPSLPYILINEVFENTSLEIYDTASWKKKSCIPLSGHPNRLTRIVEMVYIFAKTPNFTTNKIVSSVSKTGQKYFNTYYNFIEAKNNDGKVEGHEATFSTEFANYFIDLYSKPNDIVLDNFSGTGTTPYASSKMGRQYIGIDLVEDYCDYARERLSKLYKENSK